MCAVLCVCVGGGGEGVFNTVRDIISTVRDILSVVGNVQYRGGYHDAFRELSRVLLGVFSTMGGGGGKGIFICYLCISMVLNTPTVFMIRSPLDLGTKTRLSAQIFL